MCARDAGVSRNIAVDRSHRQDRQADVESAIRLNRIVDRRDGAIPNRRQAARIADRDERGQAKSVAMIPAFADDFRPDPGGIAERDC
jgi:hypothetical protein